MAPVQLGKPEQSLAQEMIGRIERIYQDPQPEPDTLYHYTNISGLIGIVENNEIWASNVVFLNDEMELQHGINVASSIITSLLYKQKDKETIKLLKSAVRDLESKELPSTYAACFCAKPDLLSQWRGYAGSEQGVCIHFETDGLKKIFSDLHGRLNRVIYRKAQSEPLIKAYVEEFINRKANISNAPEKTDRELLFEVLSELIPQLKNYGFREEHEWRFIVQQASAKIIKFRAKGSLIVPYIKVGAGTLKMPIKKITIGPGKHQDLTSRSIEAFLEAKRYSGIEMVNSKVPYRT